MHARHPQGHDWTPDGGLTEEQMQLKMDGKLVYRRGLKKKLLDDQGIHHPLHPIAPRSPFWCCSHKYKI
jgi:hypothetical protein